MKIKYQKRNIIFLDAVESNHCIQQLFNYKCLGTVYFKLTCDAKALIASNNIIEHKYKIGHTK